MRNNARARGEWSAPTSDVEAFRRAGGRRAYNAVRQFRAAYRRFQLVTVAAESGLGLWRRGVQRELATRLGVSRSTISRDIKAILAEVRPGRPCPVCRCTVRHSWRGAGD